MFLHKKDEGKVETVFEPKFKACRKKTASRHSSSYLSGTAVSSLVTNHLGFTKPCHMMLRWQIKRMGCGGFSAGEERGDSTREETDPMEDNKPGALFRPLQAQTTTPKAARPRVPVAP